jgi:uncharacterized LabA/DUF88 family protein
LLFSGSVPLLKVRVYIDGFNLYYRALKHRPDPNGGTYKWLDLVKMASALMPSPSYTIDLIRYFTANVRQLPDDPDAPLRQQVYLRALRTLPLVTIHHGFFMAKKTRMRLVTPLGDGTKTVEVHKTEEKGSDVNMATHLLLDGFRNEYDVAAVVTNDSDLVEPVRVVRDELKKTVIILAPDPRRCSRELSAVATGVKPIREGALRSSQFPNPLADAKGTITKPAGW